MVASHTSPLPMDIVSKEKRSEIMSKVRCKYTKPEKSVRSLLHSMGYRFCFHRRDLPGKPVVVLPKYKTVIFGYGCFWHGRDCNKGNLPKTKHSFGKRKIEGNVIRDKMNTDQLAEKRMEHNSGLGVRIERKES